MSKNIKQKDNKILVYSNIIFISITIILIFVVINLSSKDKKNSVTITHDNDSSYLFTNPILDCEVNDDQNNTYLNSKEINEKVLQVKEKYNLSHISLYFRDLNNGQWVGVKEKEVFSPASLLKVPILMSFLHDAEKDKSILDKRVVITTNEINKNVTPNIKDDGTLVVGNSYTLDEVAESMIIKSDNLAVAALINNINNNNISGVFKSIGVPFMDLMTEVDISVKDYAGFFRVLYNSSYLNRDMSEKALELMSRVDYRDGIVAGVPDNIKVSHKFGERTFSNMKSSSQLHDCGIIYYPSSPYILCVMTRGSDFSLQSKAIIDLSKYIYSEVDNLN